MSEVKPCHEDWYSSADLCDVHGSPMNDNGQCETVRADRAEAQVQAVRELYEFYRTSPVNECSQTDLLGEIARVLGGDA